MRASWSKPGWTVEPFRRAPFDETRRCLFESGQRPFRTEIWPETLQRLTGRIVIFAKFALSSRRLGLTALHGTLALDLNFAGRPDVLRVAARCARRVFGRAIRQSHLQRQRAHHRSPGFRPIRPTAGGIEQRASSAGHSAQMMASRGTLVTSRAVLEWIVDGVHHECPRSYTNRRENRALARLSEDALLDLATSTAQLSEAPRDGCESGTATKPPQASSAPEENPRVLPFDAVDEAFIEFPVEEAIRAWRA